MGATGPAGDSAVLPQFASGSVFSYSEKQVCSQDATQFDISSLQSGISVADNYQSLVVHQTGTYVVEFGMLISNVPCDGDCIALELNHAMIIEESRMPAICENTFVTGVCILCLREDDEISLIAENQNGFDLCCRNNTINAYLVVHQINC